MKAKPSQKKQDRFYSYHMKWTAWDGNTHNAFNPERELWLEVLMTHFEDLQKDIRVCAKKGTIKDTAGYNYFFGDTRECALTCDDCGADFGYVQLIAKKMIEGAIIFNARKRIAFRKLIMVLK